MSEDSNWGAVYGASTPSQDEISPVDNRKRQAREIARWFFGISILLMLISMATSLSGGSSRTSAVDEFFNSQTESSDTSSWDSSWVPSDFTVWSSDSNIAWKWADKGTYSCDNYSCITVEFISRDGCPTGLYAALNWLDRNDAVVSYDNETLPSLLPNQVAKLRFDDVQEIGDSGQMAEISCR